MTTPDRARTLLASVGDKTYPTGGESEGDALTRLLNDTAAATTALTPGEELRLRQMISKWPGKSYTNYGQLRKFLGSYVASFSDTGEAVAYLSTTQGFSRGGIVFRVKPNLITLKEQLDSFPSVHVVISGVSPAALANAGLATRVIVVDSRMQYGVCEGLIRQLSGMSLQVVNDVSAAAIYQSPQERGDMHDIRPLLLLDKTQKVTVCVSDPDTWGDAAEILNYYLGFDDRVFITFQGAPERNKAKGVLRVTDATRILFEKAIDGDIKTVLAEATTGPAAFTTEEATAFQKDLMAHGWVAPKAVTKKLVIVNFRDSGHAGSLIREASHPELDTGTEGFKQLLKLAAEKDGTPVPMGHRRDLAPSTGPNLLEYWKWDCCREVKGQPRRLREYRLLRFIAQSFGQNVVALSLRSGSTDALSYCGISLISVDLALEGCSRDEAIARKLVTLIQSSSDLAFPFGHPGSWRRTIKRLLIVPKVFHQVYITRLRADDGNKFNPNWPGAFLPEDLNVIAQAYDLYFTKGLHTELPPNSPLRAAGFAQAVTLFYDPTVAKALASDTDSDGFKLVKSRVEKQETRQANKVVAEATDELAYLTIMLQKYSNMLK